MAQGNGGNGGGPATARGRADFSAHPVPAKHVGIVACSAEGAALCYRTFCVDAVALMGKYQHPEVSLHTHALGEYMRFIEADNWDGVAQLMLSSAEKLAGSGAELLICPDNTIHQVFPQVRAVSPLPWLHIADEVLREARRRGWQKLGVLGTRYLMEGPVYRDAAARHDLGFQVPGPAEREQVNRVIFDELVNGQVTDTARAEVLGIIGQLARAGCEAVVLGCTELPLLVREGDSPLPTLDSTRLLARAALREALRGRGG